MKLFRLLTITIVLCFLSMGAASAQCTPDPNGPTTPGIYPGDSLPNGNINVAYSQEIQLVLPRDTTVDVFGTPFSASFCEFEVIFANLPAGLTAACDVPSCKWTIDHTAGVISRGCITISGTPTDSVPNDTLVATVIITPGLIDSSRNNFCNTDSLKNQAGALWAIIQGLLTQPASIGLKIEKGNVGIADELRAEMNLSIAPNPTSGDAFVGFNMQQPREVAIDLYDMLGRKVQEIQSNTTLIGSQKIRFSTSQLNPGLYFIKMNINQGEAVLSEKLHIIR
jgi:hypothetical protein